MEDEDVIMDEDNELPKNSQCKLIVLGGILYILYILYVLLLEIKIYSKKSVNSYLLFFLNILLFDFYFTCLVHRSSLEIGKRKLNI